MRKKKKKQERKGGGTIHMRAKEERIPVCPVVWPQNSAAARGRLQSPQYKLPISRPRIPVAAKLPVPNYFLLLSLPRFPPRIIRGLLVSTLARPSHEPRGLGGRRPPSFSPTAITTTTITGGATKTNEFLIDHLLMSRG